MSRRRGEERARRKFLMCLCQNHPSATTVLFLLSMILRSFTIEPGAVRRVWKGRKWEGICIFTNRKWGRGMSG